MNWNRSEIAWKPPHFYIYSQFTQSDKRVLLILFFYFSQLCVVILFDLCSQLQALFFNELGAAVAFNRKPFYEYEYKYTKTWNEIKKREEKKRTCSCYLLHRTAHSGQLTAPYVWKYDNNYQLSVFREFAMKGNVLSLIIYEKSFLNILLKFFFPYRIQLNCLNETLEKQKEIVKILFKFYYLFDITIIWPTECNCRHRTIKKKNESVHWSFSDSFGVSAIGACHYYCHCNSLYLLSFKFLFVKILISHRFPYILTIQHRSEQTTKGTLCTV